MMMIMLYFLPKLLRYLFVSRSDWVPPTSDVAASVAPIAPLTTLMSDAPGDSFSPSCYSNVESAHLDSSVDSSTNDFAFDGL